MQLTVLTPDSTVFSGDILSVYAPSESGILGILPNHADLTTNLTYGELKVDTGSETKYFSIGSGFLRVEKNHVSVLISRGIDMEKLDEAAIIEAKKAADEALAQKPTGVDLIHFEALKRQAITDLKLFSKHKNHRSI